MSMPLIRAQISTTPGVQIPGTPFWPDAAHPFDEALAAVRTSMIASWLQAGRRPYQTSPVIDLDAVDGNQWVAQATTVSRTNPTASRLGYFTYTRQANDVMRHNIASDLGSYTILSLIKPTNFSGANVIMGMGVTSTSRLSFVQGTSGNLVLQHGTGDSHSQGLGPLAGQWGVVMASYDNSDKSAAIYFDSTTPLGGLFTMVNPPPTTTTFRIECGRNPDTSNPAAMAQHANILWNGFAAHKDVNSVAALMAAGAGLKALLP